MLTFPEVNGIHMECTNDEIVEVGLAVASGAMDYAVEVGVVAPSLTCGTNSNKEKCFLF